MDLIDRQEAMYAHCMIVCEKEPDACAIDCPDEAIFRQLQSAQQEDYTDMKTEFLRMASYIDVLLECSDEQKETLIGFISRLADYMPWTERD